MARRKNRRPWCNLIKGNIVHKASLCYPELSRAKRDRKIGTDGDTYADEFVLYNSGLPLAKTKQLSYY